MIERVLKRFATEDTKLIIAALNHWVDTQGGEYNDKYEMRTLVVQIQEYGSRMDKIYLRSVIRRLNKTYKEKKHAESAEREKQRALDIAGRTLLGDKFNDKNTSNSGMLMSSVISSVPTPTGANRPVFVSSSSPLQNSYQYSGALGLQTAFVGSSANLGAHSIATHPNLNGHVQMHVSDPKAKP